jgi:hypothetical protein
MSGIIVLPVAGRPGSVSLGRSVDHWAMQLLMWPIGLLTCFADLDDIKREFAGITQSVGLV